MRAYARSVGKAERHGVVGLLIALFAITYLDSVCISVAGPRIQQDLARVKRLLALAFRGMGAKDAS